MDLLLYGVGDGILGPKPKEDKNRAELSQTVGEEAATTVTTSGEISTCHFKNKKMKRHCDKIGKADC